MKKYHTLIVGGAFLMLCAGPAAAGPCTQQISKLTSTLGAPPASDKEVAARAALDRARTLDVQGSEECKSSVQEAKHLFGFDE